ncbi:H-NS family nucleoid-associated regulatory protein [Vibrio cholerae]|uniref:H-NS family histone-like protein n=1 Tax=Vibrio fluvialis TaxID=676 RepID=UPI0025726790|nr:H-NS family nucleoid-associated regulatory protein [Vibrio fluvialis]EGR4422316.1 transcriptional regulator [Vibrio cholerae]BEI26541.1 DNA-binding protein H-NS [Vibrio fluvialis]
MENEIRKVLLNIKNFRSAVRHFTLDELSDVQNKLGTIIDETKAKVKEEEKALAEQQKKLEEAAAILKASGLSIDMLSSHMKEVKPKKAKRPPKYQYEVGGKVKHWTGQGKTPRVIQDRLDQGGSLAEFLIQPEQ